MAQRIRSFDPIQMGKTLGTLYLFLGFVFAVLFWMFGSMFGRMAGGGSGMPAFGIGMVIIAPLIYACFGFIFGIIGAWLYNLVAGWTGGVEMELQ